MIVAAAEVVPLRLPLRRPLVTARGAVAIREGFLLRLISDTGEVGSGEGSPAYWIGEGSLARTADDLGRVVALVRERPSAAALRAHLLDGAASAPLSAAAGCALDGALLDLVARTRRVAVAALLAGEATAPATRVGGAAQEPVSLATRLGGAPPSSAVPAACTGVTPSAAVAIAAIVGGPTPAQLLAAVDAAVARGFTTLKLKVGVDGLATDVQRVAAVRARVGTGVRLRLDANRGWADEDARRALTQLAPFDIEYLEEPLQSADPMRLAVLARTTAVPLAVDESIVAAADLERLIAAGARVHVVLKAARVGGPTQLVALARLARAAGLPVVVTDSIESPTGMGIAVHAAAAIAGPAFAVGLGGAQLLAADDGVGVHALGVPWLVPAGPGLTVVSAGVVGEVGARA